MRIGLAVLLSAWMLLLSMATVSPDLHNWLHHQDANTCEGHCHADHSNENDTEGSNHQDHVCAVTLFASGVDCDVPVTLPDTTFLTVGNIEDEEPQLPYVFHRLFLHARAPPVVAI
jgi:hypothetical protein